ncbi:MAG: hypothetical protein IJ389_03085 [Clostridia bacterium]|nr:hypothetical protein [Clostridia bacterium]
MKKQSIEEQVSQLTLEQQDKILKVGKTAFIIQLIFLIPYILYCFFTTMFMFAVSVSGADVYWTVYFIWMVSLVIGYLPILAVPIVLKVKWPYYSDAKYRYIRKERKNKK